MPDILREFITFLRQNKKQLIAGSAVLLLLLIVLIMYAFNAEFDAFMYSKY